MKLRFFFALALSLASVSSCRAQILEPETDTLWTSTREIRDLAPIPTANGVWAATNGGILTFDGQKWTKTTRRDGLPSNDALEVLSRMHQPIARFSDATAMFSGARWEVQSAPPFQKSPLEFFWKGQKVIVSLVNLRWGETSFPLPLQSSGTHISAVLGGGKSLLVAIYGDGLWNFDGAKWTRAFTDLPAKAREITALANDGAHFWVGTRRDGIFCYQLGKWRQFLQNDEPQNANIQNLGEFNGVLYASTLDDGLICRDGNSWKNVSTPQISSGAPRQMIEWNHQFYVRHGSGVVDSFDGKTWTKNALKTVPRPGIYALGGNEKTLFAAGWGGWSEWDGQKWTPHFEIADLKNVPVMAILPDGDGLWIGTQSRGLGRFERKTGQFRFFDERDGLGDDWITTLQKADEKIYAGTFAGGLARLDGEKWHIFGELRGQNVTAIASGEQGAVWVSTRRGFWKISGNEAQKAGPDWLESETQALWKGKTGLWVGARTGLSFLKAAP